MKKKAYIKPSMEEVRIQQYGMLCTSGLNTVNAMGLPEEEDAITIGTEPIGNGFFGR